MNTYVALFLHKALSNLDLGCKKFWWKSSRGPWDSNRVLLPQGALLTHFGTQRSYISETPKRVTPVLLVYLCEQKKAISTWAVQQHCAWFMLFGAFGGWRRTMHPLPSYLWIQKRFLGPLHLRTKPYGPPTIQVGNDKGSTSVTRVNFTLLDGVLPKMFHCCGYFYDG